MSSNWYVLDLETTGFDARTEEICEISISQVSYDLEPLHRYARTMGGNRQVQLINDGEHEFVKDMHTKTGLLTELTTDLVVLNTTMNDVDYELTEWFKLSELGQGKDEKPIIIGSTIGFDIRFIIEYFPRFYRLIHHRTIDVSSIKELARVWAPDLLESVPEIPKDATKHRATDDTENTLMELSHYKQLFDLWNIIREQAEQEANLVADSLNADTTHDISPVPPQRHQEYCKVCEKPILSMTYKGTGVCSVDCSKKLYGDAPSVKAYELVEYLEMENAALAAVIKNADSAAAQRGEAYNKAAGVVIESNGAGMVTVRATNLDIFYTEWLDVKSASPDPFTWRLASRLLVAIASSLPSGPGKFARMEVSDDAQSRLKFKSGTAKASLPLMPLDTFPTWGVFSPDNLVDVPGLTRILTMVEWAVSDDETPPVLRGVHFDGRHVYGTNRLRAARAEFEVPMITEPFTIPVDVVGRIIRTAGGGDSKVEYLGDRLHLMPNPHTQIQVIAYEDKFPNIANLWITNQPPDKIIISRTRALEIFNRALPISVTDRQPGMYVVIGAEKLAAYATTEDGSASSGDVMEITGHGRHVRQQFFFIPQNLIAAFDAAPSENVQVNYDRHDPAKPWIISCGDEYSAIVVPRKKSAPVQSDAD